uniref:tRNA (adenine(58)-N(1))-methyltransferase non-catalytic subunit TRM6 n=1 Tax=Trichuris muris TaxID=70415 RepID=A0A5S6QJH3_TRIMR
MEITEGSYVIFKRGDAARLTRVNRGQQIVLEKSKFLTDNLIGQCYNQLYEILPNKHLHLCTETELSQFLNSESFDGDQNGDSIDFGDQSSQERTVVAEQQCNQTVSFDELKSMKSSGASGEDIVQLLVDGSLSYKRKTDFAKRKYVQRKRRKHSGYVLALKPCIRLLAEVYYRKNPAKLMDMRPDYFAYLLSCANVHYGSKVLVVEDCCGLISAAVLDRSGGNGLCLQLHRGDQCQSVPCLDAMQYTSSVMQCYRKLPICVIMDEPAANGEKLESNSPLRSKHGEALRLFKEGNFDSLIIASKYDLSSVIVNVLLPAIRPSGTVAIYSDVMQLAVEYFDLLRTSQQTVELELVDSFLRHHQVLPNRTRPDMSGYFSPGYVLTGVVVCN